MWSAVLCTVSLAYPLVAAHRAASVDALERWRAYLVCFGLFALPLLAWPWWLPLRAEMVVLVTLVLGAHDARGAHALHTRYVVPLVAPWIGWWDAHSWDDLFAAAEARVLPGAEDDEDEEAEDDEDEEAEDDEDDEDDEDEEAKEAKEAVAPPHGGTTS